MPLVVRGRCQDWYEFLFSVLLSHRSMSTQMHHTDKTSLWSLSGPIGTCFPAGKLEKKRVIVLVHGEFAQQSNEDTLLKLQNYPNYFFGIKVNDLVYWLCRDCNDSLFFISTKILRVVFKHAQTQYIANKLKILVYIKRNPSVKTICVCPLQESFSEVRQMHMHTHTHSLHLVCVTTLIVDSAFATFSYCILAVGTGFNWSS